VRFHTTFKDIVVALSILLICAAIALVGVIQLGLSGPGTWGSERVLALLERDGALTVTVGTIERDYLKTLNLFDISLAIEDVPILLIDRLRVEGGVTALLKAFLGIKTAVAITAEGVDLHATEALLTLFSGGESAPSLRLLKHLVIDLSVDDLTAHLVLGDRMATLAGLSLELHYEGSTSSLAYASGTASAITYHQEALSLTLEEIVWGVDETGLIALRSEEGSAHTPQWSLSLANLNALSPLDRSLSLSAFEVTANTEVGQVFAPRLFATAQALSASGGEFTLSFDSLDLINDSFFIAVPTMSLSAHLEEWDITRLGIITKEGEPIHFSSGAWGDGVASDLSGSARYRSATQVALQLGVGSLKWSDTVVEARARDLMSTATLSIKNLAPIDLTAALSGHLDAKLLDRTVSVETPLSADLSWSADGGATTVSVSMEGVVSDLVDLPIEVTVDYQGKEGEGMQVQSQLNLANQLNLFAVYDQSTAGQELMLTGRLSRFEVDRVTSVIDRWAPFLKPYYDEQTQISGNLSITGRLGSSQSGRAALDLVINDANVGRLDLDAGFTFIGDLEDRALNVEAATLATSGYRLSFSGDLELGHWLPRGVLSLFSTEEGTHLATADIRDLVDEQYAVALRTHIEPYFTIDGTIHRKDATQLGGDGHFGIWESSYPFDFSLSTDTLHLTLNQKSALALTMSLAPPISFTVATNGFAIPAPKVERVAHSWGALSGEFESLGAWSLAGGPILLEGAKYRDRPYDLLFTLDANAKSVKLTDVEIMGEGRLWHSSFAYQGTDLATLVERRFLAPFESSLTLRERDGGTLQVALFGSEEEISSVVRMREFELFPLLDVDHETRANISLVGSTDLVTTLDYDATLALEGPKLSLSGMLRGDERTLTLDGLTGRYNKISYRGEELTFKEGRLSLTGHLEHTRHLSYIDQLSHLGLDAHLTIGGVETLFDLPASLSAITRRIDHIDLGISDILLFGEGGLADDQYTITFKDDGVGVTSTYVDLYYRYADQWLGATVDRGWGIGLKAEGHLGADNFGLQVNDIYFPLTLINRTYLKPVFAFYTGIAEGEVFLAGSRDAVRPYGQLMVNSTEMFVFWLPDDRIVMKNVSVTIDGDRATTAHVPFFSTNQRTGRTVTGYGWLAAHFDGLQLLNYEIHADSGDQPIYIWIPMNGYDVDIRGYAAGEFNLFGIGFQTWLDGDVVISDTSLTMGIKGLPEWYVPMYLTSTEFNVKTAKNVTFFYPNTPTPIIRATISEGQDFRFSYNHLTDDFEVDGSLGFRSGEIYYFQKNFLITEGSLLLHTDALSGSNVIVPRINLRAKITDFDAHGERLDIYMVLRDSSLANLNPQFESTPFREVNEIMEILGQSILPSGAYGEVNLYSMANLAAAATDVAERLGLLDISQTTQLTETIRISLGLDMFSLRSNIVQNILFDALPLTGWPVSTSPIARYLHNTSIFMGKYLGRSFFLQAMVHLSAMERSQVRNSFLSPDLSLDLELSLDWENPLATVSFFTQPDELSFITILDTMGFSVTKRIILR
jgi:hypothetical protein